MSVVDATIHLKDESMLSALQVALKAPRSIGVELSV